MAVSYMNITPLIEMKANRNYFCLIQTQLSVDSEIYMPKQERADLGPRTEVARVGSGDFSHGSRMFSNDNFFLPAVSCRALT